LRFVTDARTIAIAVVTASVTLGIPDERVHLVATHPLA
jgi:hypothetical protein